MENKVNLFIVGAMKAGTTSFVELLSQHEEIYVSPVKEPHYFVNSLPKNLYEPSRFFSLDSYLKNTFPEPLHITKVKTEAQYKKIFSVAKVESYLADASTAYLHAEEAAELIYNYNPNAKIIILLRDPIKRAFSHYKMNLGKGRESRTFEAAMQTDIELFSNNNLQWYSYLGMSFYDKAIERYKSRFEHVQLIHFEDLMNIPDDTFAALDSFLKISPFIVLENRTKNESKTLRFQKVFYMLKQLGLNDYFSKIFSSTFKQWLFKAATTNENQEMELSKETKTILEELFRKESQQWSS